VIDELRRTQGFLSEETLKQLAIDTFSLTREYDNQIYNYFRGGDSVTLDLEKVLSLRYGENPHQGAALYKIPGDKNLKFCRLQGKELSFNNILDLDTAMAMCKEFSEPAAIIVKHASLCGVGVDKKIAGAFHKAHLTDPISSFGGIISLNRKVDKDTAIKIMKSDFKECVIAPGYSNEAIKIFSAKKNLRVLEADFEQALDFKDIRTTLFGYLIQDRDLIGLDKDNLKIVTRKKPTQSELKDILFAWKVVQYVKSNAIVVAKGLRVCGIGAGQPSRVGSAKIALEKAGQVCKGAVLASDGFFPKEDTIKLAYRKGIRAIIQPGGSIKDQDIIKLCDQLKISMIFTNVRHFRH
jgi:phosphoribosylaminoimidazolecarboxamide formyltransferase/IMP cyclohydrolase